MFQVIPSPFKQTASCAGAIFEQHTRELLMPFDILYSFRVNTEDYFVRIQTLCLIFCGFLFRLSDLEGRKRVPLSMLSKLIAQKTRKCGPQALQNTGRKEHIYLIAHLFV